MGDHSASPSISDRMSWPIRKFRLGSEPGPNLSAVTTPEQRIEMVWPLTLEAWAFAGRPIPEYSRSETPVRRRPMMSTPVD
jgi:hypothetical protein